MVFAPSTHLLIHGIDPTSIDKLLRSPSDDWGLPFPSDGRCNAKTDIWNLSLIILEMLTGRSFTYEYLSPKEVTLGIEDGRIYLIAIQICSPGCRQAVLHTIKGELVGLVLASQIFRFGLVPTRPFHPTFCL